MKIQRTTVTETADGFRVEMLFADSPDPDATTDAISIAFDLASEDRFPRLAELQQATLRHARAAIDHEIYRLELEKGRNP